LREMLLISRERALLFLKGMAMGAADSVPGVSGGTIALITNIYEELVDAIRAIGPHVLVTWKREGFPVAWREINGNFLLTLLLGIISSLLLFGRVILVLMDSYLPFLLAFFSGLVMASIFYVTRLVSRWNALNLILFIAGTGFAILLASLPLAQSSNHLLYYFFSGAIAICAMILPGISGAFILVLLGVYGPVLEALTNFEWVVIGVFAGGCACGLMLFSRILSWLLHHHHDRTLSTLIGLLVGSLYLLWPWRVATELNFNSHAFTQFRHVSPGDYQLLTGSAVSPWLVMFLIVIGAGLVLLLETVAVPGKGELSSKDREG